MNSRRRVTAALIGLLVLVAGAWFGNQAPSSAPVDAPPGGSRPGVAAEVWQLIQHNGPFPHRWDGTVFGNREGGCPSARPASTGSSRSRHRASPTGAPAF